MSDERDKIRELWNSEIDALLEQDPGSRSKDVMTWINNAATYLIPREANISTDALRAAEKPITIEDGSKPTI